MGQPHKCLKTQDHSVIKSTRNYTFLITGFITQYFPTKSPMQRSQVFFRNTEWHNLSHLTSKNAKVCQFHQRLKIEDLALDICHHLQSICYLQPLIFWGGRSVLVAYILDRSLFYHRADSWRQPFRLTFPFTGNLALPINLDCMPFDSGSEQQHSSQDKMLANFSANPRCINICMYYRLHISTNHLISLSCFR